MLCKKCGTNVPEGTSCPSCGHTHRSTKGKSGGVWIDKYIKFSKFIIFVLQLGICLFTLTSLLTVRNTTSVVPTANGFQTVNNQGENAKFLITTYLPSIIGMILCITNIIYSHKKKALKNYRCPKCKAITYHNRYNVCTNCDFDIESNIYLSFFYFLISFFIPVLVPVILFILFVILAPIYMYPAKLARRSEHTAATAIFWLNLLLGGTLIMWIILMIWASSGGHKKSVIVQQTISQPVTSQPIASQPVMPQPTASNSFEELKKLKDMGMITDEEFEEKRKELLKRI